MTAELLVGAFMAGTSFAAAAGTFAESRAKASARLDRPFVDRQRFGMSMLQMLLAGPYLLAGEAALARDEGRCGLAVWTVAILFAAAWCLALGIVWLELLWQIAQHLW